MSKNYSHTREDFLLFLRDIGLEIKDQRVAAHICDLFMKTSSENFVFAVANAYQHPPHRHDPTQRLIKFAQELPYTYRTERKELLEKATRKEQEEFVRAEKEVDTLSNLFLELEEYAHRLRNSYKQL